MTDDKHSVCVCVAGCPVFLQRAEFGSCVWNLTKVFTCWVCLGLETTIWWVKMFKILHLVSDLGLSSACRSCGAYMLGTLSCVARVGDPVSSLFLYII